MREEEKVVFVRWQITRECNYSKANRGRVINYFNLAEFPEEDAERQKGLK